MPHVHLERSPWMRLKYRYLLTHSIAQAGAVEFRLIEPKMLASTCEKGTNS